MKRNFPHFNRVCSPDALRVLPGPPLYRVRRPVRLGSFSWVTQGPDAQGGRSLQGAVPLVREGVRAKIPSLWLCCCSPQAPQAVLLSQLYKSTGNSGFAALCVQRRPRGVRPVAPGDELPPHLCS